MQNEEDIKFDRIIRSKLSGYEEEVPPQMWDEIASRLDARRNLVIVPWWRKAMVGVAVAAAVAAGVFLFLPGNDNSNYSHNDTLAAVDVLPAAPQTPEIQEVTPDLPAPVQSWRPSSVPSQSQAVSSDARPAKAAPVVSAATEAPAEVAPETPVATEAPDEDVVAVQAPAAEVVAEEEPTADAAESEEAVAGELPAQDVDDAPQGDPFAELAWEESRSRKSRQAVSIKVGGDIQTNGNPQSVRASGARRAMVAEAPRQTSISQISQASSYSVPISAGISVRIPVAPKWSVGAGVNWSILERTFRGTYTEVSETPRSITTDIRHYLHYVGVPVNVFYDVFSGRMVDFYAFAGGTVEKAVISHYRVPYEGRFINYRESVPGVQWSAAIGFGIGFNLSRYLGLYIDPSLRYYFPCSQPTSIRTQQPLMMGLEAGLRFKF